MFGHQLTKRKLDILEAILAYRSVTAEQLISILNPSKYPISDVRGKESPAAKTGLGNARRDLAQLIKQGLVKSVVFESRKAYYHLTEEGQEVISLFLNIPLGHIGTGFNKDLGDFPYKLQMVKPARIKHHLLLVDMFIKLVEIQKELPLDFRDNRYCSIDFELEGSKFKIKPDGELTISGENYFIEIDRATERGAELNTKFELYNRYFNYLSQNNKPLPKAILFITDNRELRYGLDRRWKSLIQSFFLQSGNWAHMVNLTYGSFNEIGSIIQQEAVQQEMYYDAFIEKYVKGKIKYYFQNPDYKGSTFIEWGEERFLFSISQSHGHHQLFLYEQENGFETKGWARYFHFLELFQKYKDKVDHFKNVVHIIPVYYSYDRLPSRDISFTDYKEDKGLKKWIHPPIRVDLKDNPIWSDHNGQRILGNPFLIRR
jgi:DNA-binding PadR family transcriptional regulator